MYKGIVIEVNENYIIVMKQDASMLKIKFKEGISVGDKIYFFTEDILIQKSNRINKRVIASIAAMLTFVMLIFKPVFQKETYAVISFDINPSIELQVDKNGIITSVKGMNDQGEELNIEYIKGLTIEKGVEKLKSELAKDGYINKNNSLLVGFAFSEEDDKEFEDKLQKSIKTSFKDIDIAYVKGDKGTINEANKRNVSLGRCKANMKLEDDFIDDMLENLTVDELIDLLKSNDKTTIYWDSDVIEEIQDELEDRIEDKQDKDDD